MALALVFSRPSCTCSQRNSIAHEVHLRAAQRHRPPTLRASRFPRWGCPLAWGCQLIGWHGIPASAEMEHRGVKGSATAAALPPAAGAPLAPSIPNHFIVLLQGSGPGAAGLPQGQAALVAGAQAGHNGRGRIGAAALQRAPCAQGHPGGGGGARALPALAPLLSAARKRAAAPSGKGDRRAMRNPTCRTTQPASLRPRSFTRPGAPAARPCCPN